MEHWRDVPGYEGKYQISIDTPEGKCRTLSYKRGKETVVLKNCYAGGYIVWSLCKNRKVTSQQAARWIALTFPELVENEYFEGAEIDHKDTCRLNNHPSNLRWVTRSGNQNNPITKKHISVSKKDFYKNNPLAYQNQTNSPSRSVPVVQYSLTGDYIDWYPSAREAARKTNGHSAHISSCCTGKRKTSGGFIWKYQKKEVL